MSYPTPSKAVDAAMRARSDLNIFAGIVAILEGGTISGGSAAAAKIIKICKAEQQRQLRIMDRAVAETNRPTAKGAVGLGGGA